jgi:hypothetical protein
MAAGEAMFSFELKILCGDGLDVKKENRSD